MSFTSVFVEERATRKGSFLNRINKIIDWSLIEKEIKKYYNKGFSVAGRPSYSGLLLFKMQLLQIWYKMSDVEVEDFVNDSLSAMHFCGLNIEDRVPDHSTLSRFRSELSKKGAYDKLLRKLNEQLEEKGIKVKEGHAIVDASITETPFKPKGKKIYDVLEKSKKEGGSTSGNELNDSKIEIIVNQGKGVDEEANWTQKNGKWLYGYKKSIASDEDTYVNGVETGAANEHDSKLFGNTLDKVPKPQKQASLSDKAYDVPGVHNYLKSEKIIDFTMKKAVRNHPLTDMEKAFNKLISKERYKVERIFGSIKRWFRGGIARYKGKKKVHAQHVIEAIAYNLYITPGIVIKKGIML